MAVAQVRNQAAGALIRAGRDSLVRNSLLVMITTATNAGFGFLYWIAAARLFPEAEVGRATAVIAALNVAAVFANLGLSTSLVDQVPGLDRRRWTEMTSTIFAAALAASTVAAVTAWIILPVAVPSVAPLVRSAIAPVVLVGVVAWVLAILLDHVFIAERRAEGMLARNAFAAICKLIIVVLLGLAGMPGSTAVVLSWVAALAGSVIIVGGRGLRRLGRQAPAPRSASVADIRAIAKPALLHHLANLGGEFPMFLLPIIVIMRAGDEASAFFYVTWMVGGIFFTVSTASAQSLFAEGSARVGEPNRQLRTTLGLTALLLTPALIGVPLFGDWILGAFGARYAEAGTGLLILLVVSAIPDGITNIWVARWRVLGLRIHVAAINIAMAVFAIAFAWIFVPSLGIAAVGWAWILSQTLGCVYTAVIEIRRRSDGAWASPGLNATADEEALCTS